MENENKKGKYGILLLILSIVMLVVSNIYFIDFFSKTTVLCHGLFNYPSFKDAGSIGTVMKVGNFVEGITGKVIIIFITVIIPVLIAVYFHTSGKNISIPAFINSGIALLLIVATLLSSSIMQNACNQVIDEIKTEPPAQKNIEQDKPSGFLEINELSSITADTRNYPGHIMVPGI